MVDHLSAGKDLARVLHKSAASALKRAPRTQRVWLCVRVCVFVCVRVCMIVSHESAAHILCVCYSFCNYHFFFYFMLSIFLQQVLHKSASSALKSQCHVHTVCVLLRTRRSSLLPITALF